MKVFIVVFDNESIPSLAVETGVVFSSFKGAFAYLTKISEKYKKENGGYMKLKKDSLSVSGGEYFIIEKKVIS